jgi:hypothetical protein
MSTHEDSDGNGSSVGAEPPAGSGNRRGAARHGAGDTFSLARCL